MLDRADIGPDPPACVSAAAEGRQGSAARSTRIEFKEPLRSRYPRISGAQLTHSRRNVLGFQQTLRIDLANK